MELLCDLAGELSHKQPRKAVQRRDGLGLTIVAKEVATRESVRNKVSWYAASGCKGVP